MCEHESKPCPGESCRCECMNCTFPMDNDDICTNCRRHEDDCECCSAYCDYYCYVRHDEPDDDEPDDDEPDDDEPDDDDPRSLLRSLYRASSGREPTTARLLKGGA